MQMVCTLVRSVLKEFYIGGGMAEFCAMATGKKIPTAALAAKTKPAPKGNTGDKKELAKILFTSTSLTLKEIAEKTGVTEMSVAQWAKAGMWEEYRKSMLTTRDEQLRLLYEQLANLNAAIMDGAGYPTDKEVNTQKKLAASIASLEKDTSVGQVIQVAKEYIDWLKKGNLQLAKDTALLFDGFINDKLKHK
jgi:transcriptional regulator with XRE-family HTH domain